MKEVAPGIFVESSYPPYNVVLIKTSKGGILIDLPPNPVHAMSWLEQARALANPLRYMVMTDAKRERQFATVVCNVPIISTVAVRHAMSAYTEERVRREFAEAFTTQYPEEVRVLDKLVPHMPALSFEGNFTFYTPERNLRFEAILGAAPGSLWVHVSDQDLLIAGDTVVENAVPLMAHTPDSKAWLDTMNALAHRSTVRSIVPGLGGPIINNGDIEPQREFMRVMRRAARTLTRKNANGLSVTQTAQELGQTFFNRQGQKAVKEIKAGLEHLLAELAAEDASKEEDTD